MRENSNFGIVKKFGKIQNSQMGKVRENSNLLNISVGKTNLPNISVGKSNSPNVKSTGKFKFPKWKKRGKIKKTQMGKSAGKIKIPEKFALCAETKTFKKEKGIMAI